MIGGPGAGGAQGGAIVVAVRVAVVIPTLHEAGHIEATLRRALAEDVDVIVADGGSRDRTLDLARALGARVVSCDPGRACQLQAGYEAALDSDTVLFLHADTLLPEGWRRAVARALTDETVVGGAFSLRFAEGGRGLRAVAWGVGVRSALFGRPYGDQAIFARRTALAAVGGVPQAPIMEDLDLVAALRRCGALRILPEAVVTSGRRYLRNGVAWTVLRNQLALLARGFGVSAERIAAWYGAGSPPS